MSTALARPVGRPPGPLLIARRQRAALEELQWRGICADPLHFLGVVSTLNEHAREGESPVQPFPICPVCAKDPVANEAIVVHGVAPLQIAVCRAHGRRHKPYFAPITRQWQQEEIVLLEKSRQMLASLLFGTLYLWLALTRPGTLIAFQSLNQDKAAELVERAALSYATLPRELQRFGPLSDVPKARARKIEGRLEFRHTLPTGAVALSRLFAIPNGKNQVRMYTFSGLFMDECQLWEPDEDFEESYAAALPTVKGGGRLTAISSVGSANAFHYRLIRGEAA